MSKITEGDAEEIRRKYADLLSEEEKKILNELQPSPSETPISETAVFRNRGILRPGDSISASEMSNFLQDAVDYEAGHCCLQCTVYLIMLLIYWFSFGKEKSRDVVLSFIFVACVRFILSYRREGGVDRERIHESCLDLGIALYLWDLQVMYLYCGYSPVSIFALCLLVPGAIMLCIRRRKIFDMQEAFIAFLGYNMTLFFFIYIIQLKLSLLHIVLLLVMAYETNSSIQWINKCDKATLLVARLRNCRSLWCTEGIAMIFLLVDSVMTGSGRKPPIKSLSFDARFPLYFDARFPLYVATYYLLVLELLSRALMHRCDAVKNELKGAEQHVDS
ncbi:MAG: hypothetical protein LBQ90_06815 [Synergistaceae bacterium]|jgi:hypothetical protein|nr:hypothetical protein [Synergistaceae bacterium]